MISTQNKSLYYAQLSLESLITTHFLIIQLMHILHYLTEICPYLIHKTSNHKILFGGARWLSLLTFLGTKYFKIRFFFYAQLCTKIYWKIWCSENSHRLASCYPISFGSDLEWIWSQDQFFLPPKLTLNYSNDIKMWKMVIFQHFGNFKK